MTVVRLDVAGYADSDPQERAKLAWRLQEELRALEVEDVSQPRSATPSGAKGAGLEWAQLVVTLSGSLPPLIQALRGWLGRHPGATITVEIDGDQLSISDASPRERQGLVAAWMARHGG